MKKYESKLIKATQNFIQSQGTQTPLEHLKDILSCIMESQTFGEMAGCHRGSIHNTIKDLSCLLNEMGHYRAKWYKSKKENNNRKTTKKQ